MFDKQKMLVAVDDSDASRRAVSYVAAFLAGCVDVSVRLLHVLPHLPLIVEPEKMAQPAVGQAKRILREAGVSEHAIETQLYPSVATDDIVDDILEVARQGSFGTIVVGRDCWPRLKEAFRHHICHELIKKARGVTVWVVE
jgi:K+-sensing histidine kinase KdpD